MIDVGDIFYTKELQTGIKPGAPKMKLKKHAVAVLLGVVKDNKPPALKDIVIALANGPNLIRLDDIVEAFSEKEVDEKLIPFIKEKYK